MARIYLCISDSRVSAKNLKTGAALDAPAMVALTGKEKQPRLLAAGQEAADMPVLDGMWKVRPFDVHPRVLVGDFPATEALLNYALRAVVKKWGVVAPEVFIHVSKPLAGGLSAIERRALMEAAEAAGAKKVVFIGPDAVEGLSQEALEESLRKIKI